MMIRPTIAHLAAHQQRRYGARILFHSFEAGRWRPTSYRSASEQARRLGAGLWTLGCRHGDRVAILSESSAEWCIADLAILGLGAVVVGVYPTSTVDQIHYILAHSECRVALVEDDVQLQKIAAAAHRPLPLETVVHFDDGEGEGEGEGEQARPFTTLSLAALEQRGEQKLLERPDLVERCLDGVRPHDVASLVYTSGTTGPPKGVVLTHRSLFEIADISARVLAIDDQDVSVVFLPLAHSLQRVSMYAGMRAGVSGYFAPSLDQLVETWQAAQPTLMSSVPRVFEKMHHRILSGVEEQPPHRQHLFRAAIALGRARSRYLQQQQAAPWLLETAYRLVDRVVFSRIRARIFGRRLRYLISGGAPIAMELLEFFHAMGILILEGWGLTETSAPATLNRLDDYRFGTVGKPLPGVELKLAADDEVLVRGPGLFREYYRDPEATAAAFDPDGWFRTGDIGEFDADGFLRITDRKKDLIITAGGKNVAPQNLENLLRADPIISHASVHGDRRKYLVALITLDPEELRRWARDHGKDDLGWARLVDDPEVDEMVAGIVHRVNAGLARYETIKAFRIVPDDFSIDAGLLTPTLKLRRRAIEQRYAELLDGLYADRRR